MIEINKVKDITNQDITKLIVVGSKTAVEAVLSPKQAISSQQKIEVKPQAMNEPLFKIY